MEFLLNHSRKRRNRASAKHFLISRNLQVRKFPLQNVWRSFNPHLFLIRDEIPLPCRLLPKQRGFNPHLFLIRDEIFDSATIRQSAPFQSTSLFNQRWNPALPQVVASQRGFNPHLFLIRDEIPRPCLLKGNSAGFNPHLFLIRDEINLNLHSPFCYFQFQSTSLFNQRWNRSNRK